MSKRKHGTIYIKNDGLRVELWPFAFSDGWMGSVSVSFRVCIVRVDSCRVAHGKFIRIVSVRVTPHITAIRVNSCFVFTAEFCVGPNRAKMDGIFVLATPRNIPDNYTGGGGKVTQVKNNRRRSSGTVSQSETLQRRCCFRRLAERICVHVRVYARIYAYIRVSASIYAYMRAYTRICAHLRLYASIYAYMRAYTVAVKINSEPN